MRAPCDFLAWLITAVAERSRSRRVALGQAVWRDWNSAQHRRSSSPTSSPPRFDATAERAWTVVGPFIDADGYQ